MVWDYGKACVEGRVRDGNGCLDMDKGDELVDNKKGVGVVYWSWFLGHEGYSEKVRPRRVRIRGSRCGELD